MVTLLDWDTNFFGYDIGKCTITRTNNFDIKELKNSLSHFKLIYVFSDYELPPQKGLNLVDIKVLFSKVCEFHECDDKIIRFNSKKHNYEQLLKLTYLSGSYSRFRLDKNFENDEFKRLYKEWLDKSIDNIIADKVFIKKSQDEISGFITLNINHLNIAKIGLIAVDTNYQGKNIGSNLIKACDNYSLKNGCENIEVSTQKNNEAAMKLYKKIGFQIKNMIYIYHLWNK